MAKANKQFRYVITYYTRNEVESLPATQRKAQATLVQASSATRALAKFKRTSDSEGALIVAIAPENEGRYDVGPVTVDVTQVQ